MNFMIGDVLVSQHQEIVSAKNVFIVTSNIGDRIGGLTRAGTQMLFEKSEQLVKVGEMDLRIWRELVADV